MKDTIKIVLIALPFAWLANHGIDLMRQLGAGVWLVESLSIRGYWPVSLAFYLEDFVIALITVAPYVGLIFFFVEDRSGSTVTTAVLAYVLCSFLINFQKESLTGSLFTLIQSSHVAVYLAIILVFLCADIALSMLKKRNLNAG